MSRIHRKDIKTAALIMTIVLVLAGALSGCGTGSSGQDGSVANGVIKARKIVDGGGDPPQYIYSNNISCKDASFERAKSGVSGSYIVISGLEDTAVQKKINDTIRNAFLELADKDELPPYTGWKIRFKGMDEQSRNVTTYVYGNFNNILSVQVNCWRYFTKNENGNTWGDGISEVTALNFDLRNGELLKLKDVFRDGTDYLAFLDSYMEKVIADGNSYDDTDWSWDSYSSLSLSEPFRGVDPDQKFLIHDSSATLALIFDYNDPEVCGDYPVYVNVSDNTALDLDKFMDGGLAASDKTSRVQLVYHSYPIMANPYENEEIDFGGREVDQRIQIAGYDVLTDHQNRLLAERGEENYRAARELMDAYDSFKLRYGEDRHVYAYFEEQADCSFYGPYRVISSSCYCGAYPQTREGEEYEWYTRPSETKYQVFKGDSDTPLKIDELFKEGTDWKAAVKTAARQKLDEMGAPVYFDFNAYADEYLGRISSFYPYSTALGIEFGDTSDIDAKYLADGLENWYYSSSMMYIDYGLLAGCLDL